MTSALFNRRLPPMHSVLRWPLFLTSAASVIILGTCYFFIRALVSLNEWLHLPAKVRKLRNRLMSSKSTKEYRELARRMDLVTGLNAWKKTKFSQHYNTDLVEKHIFDLQAAKEKNDLNQLIRVLKACLCEANFAGIINEALYAQCWDGSKVIVEEYVNTVIMAICHLQAALSCSPEHPNLRADIQELATMSSYGRTALFLSGGGSLATQHIGVMLTLRESGVCPDILCGTSGGAIVGAFFATRSEEEIQADCTSEKLCSMMTAFRFSWFTRLSRFIRKGAMFDAGEVYELLGKWTQNDMTFMEAFKKTGKILNVTVTTHGGNGHDPGVLLNYLTAPNVIIRSAVLCSSAFPSFFEPVGLKEKNQEGKIVERPLLKYADGSLVTDIPKEKLAAMFGVRFSIVSQVNPHVTPFFFNFKGEAGNPNLWRLGSQSSFRGGFILSATEAFVKEIMKAIVRFIRNMDLSPKVGGSPWVHVFTQNFAGDVTMTTTRYFWYKLLNALSDPVSAEEVRWWIREGSLMTWPKMSMIVSRMRIEKTLHDLAEAAFDKDVNLK